MNTDKRDLHRQALRQAQSGEWDAAHEIVQSENDTMSCLIHGYLHRVEGDRSNAAYWYRRAGETLPTNSLAEEHERLEQLLD